MLKCCFEHEICYHTLTSKKSDFVEISAAALGLTACIARSSLLPGEPILALSGPFPGRRHAESVDLVGTADAAGLAYASSNSWVEAVLRAQAQSQSQPRTSQRCLVRKPPSSSSVQVGTDEDLGVPCEQFQEPLCCPHPASRAYV